jgi:hypothetical protein
MGAANQFMLQKEAENDCAGQWQDGNLNPIP